MLASELQHRLDERWYAEQRELKRRRGRHTTAGRKPVIASLYANLPPPPSEDEWRRYLNPVDTRDGSAFGTTHCDVAT